MRLLWVSRPEGPLSHIGETNFGIAHINYYQLAQINCWKPSLIPPMLGQLKWTMLKNLPHLCGVPEFGSRYAGHSSRPGGSGRSGKASMALLVFNSLPW